jgi:methylase of polypeptide subunit release factors
MQPTPPPLVHWTDADDQPQQADWRSLAGHPPPARLAVVDDRLSADVAYRMACDGTGLLWVGDYQNARHLLQALGRRLDHLPSQRPERRGTPASDRRGRGAAASAPGAAPPTGTDALREAFLQQRRTQAHRAQVLNQLLLPFDADHGLPLRRAPDVRAAGLAAHGPVTAHYVAPLRELLGIVGAYEWRRKGVPIPALKASIHPHHGVFSPVRGEYVDLVAKAPLPAAAKPARAVDIGTGTGVLAAVLARRGLWVTATDTSPAALACAADNLARLELTERVTLQQTDLFPKGHHGLVVCNPPWVPAEAHSALDGAVYDPDSRMLRGFLAGLRAHLAPGGEGWLILSDLAEHLGLRPREQLLGWIADAGLAVRGRIDTTPQHRKADDASDPLHAARAAEVTSLWRLAAA